MAYNPTNSNGQNTMANSQPVVIASDQTGIIPWYSYTTPTSLSTATNSTSVINVTGGHSINIGLTNAPTGTFIFEGSSDGTNWWSIECYDIVADLWVSGQNITPAIGKVYSLLCGSIYQVRLRTTSTLSTALTFTAYNSNANEFIAGIDTGPAPHNFGYNLIHKDGEYITAQTGTIIWTPTTGKKFAITDITLSVYSTTTGVITFFDSLPANTTYSAGTYPAILRINVQPQQNLSVGIVKSFNVPYVSISTSNVLHITTTSAINFYWQLNGYEI